MKTAGIFTFLLLVFTLNINAQQKSYDVSYPLNSPQIFGEGIISTGDYESHPAFSPSGDTLFFLKGDPDFSTWTICVSYFKNGRWSNPEVPPFSGKYMDADPFITKDGKTLYFLSNRPTKDGEFAKADFDIWKLDLTRSGLRNPVHLDSPINSSEDEYYPTVSDNGAMYFSSRRPGGKGGTDIYRCRLENGTYSAAENLGDSVNTSDNEYEPFIAPDESYLIFMATRPNGLANADFFMSYHVDGVWARAFKLPPPFSSGGTDWSPKVTRDGKYLFFSSARNKSMGAISKEENMAELNKRIRSAGNGLGDIYQVDFSALKKVMNTIKQEGSMKENGNEEKDREALSALNAQFIKNFINNDTAAHNKIIHKDFVCIEGSGEIVDREKYMNEWAHGYDSKVYTSFYCDDEFIRIFGNVALVRSKTSSIKIDNGKIINGNSVYTDTYLKENGKWLCIQAQITRVKQPAH